MLQTLKVTLLHGCCSWFLNLNVGITFDNFTKMLIYNIELPTIFTILSSIELPTIYITSAPSRRFLGISFLLKLLYGCFNNTRSHPMVKTVGLKVLHS